MMQIKRFPVATASIITLNAVIFAIGLLSGSQTQIIQNYGFIPNHLFYVGNANYDGNNNNPADSAQQNPLSYLLPRLQSSEPQSSSSLLPESLTILFTSMFIHASNIISGITQQQNFIAELKSEMVVPPVISNATGVAYFQLDKKDNNIKYSLTATDLASVKAAHIHIGKEGENGPVIVTLYRPFSPKGQLGRILSVEDDITSDILEGPLAGKQLSVLVNFMNNRTAYVDVHSHEYPNGELRGQISNRISIGS